MSPINFKAALHSVKIDHEGECKIIMKVSLVNRKDILTLAEWTQEVLDVNVELEKEPQKVIEESRAKLNDGDKKEPEEVAFE